MQLTVLAKRAMHSFCQDVYSRQTKLPFGGGDSASPQKTGKAKAKKDAKVARKHTSDKVEAKKKADAEAKQRQQDKMASNAEYMRVKAEADAEAKAKAKEDLKHYHGMTNYKVTLI